MIKLLPHQALAIPTLLWYLTEDEGSALENPHVQNDYYRKRFEETGIKLGNRGTGRSELLAYLFIQIAMKNPGRKIYPRDIPTAFDNLNFSRNRQFFEHVGRVWRDQFKEFHDILNFTMIIGSLSIMITEKTS